MNNSDIDVELIERLIRNLDRGKAAGKDLLTCEHLLYCHPIIIVTITKLFKLKNKYHYVPDAFGSGTIIPIPKNTRGPNDQTEHNRGITISSVMFNIFERCILHCINDYNCNSSERQFGFKKGVGCSNAIYTVRKVVDYFTSNNSRVNISMLDVEKALNRLDHSV